MKKIWKWIVALAAAAVLASIILLNFVHFADENFPRSRTIQSTLAIKQALERYYIDHESYPKDIAVLARENYMPVFPLNEYHIREKWRMRPVDLSSTEFLGDFTYIPIEVNGEVTKYLLFSYAVNKEHLERGDRPWNHVAICVQQGNGSMVDPSQPRFENFPWEQ